MPLNSTHSNSTTNRPCAHLLDAMSWLPPRPSTNVGPVYQSLPPCWGSGQGLALCTPVLRLPLNTRLLSQAQLFPRAAIMPIRQTYKNRNRERLAKCQEFISAVLEAAGSQQPQLSDHACYPRYLLERFLNTEQRTCEQTHGLPNL